MAGRGPDVAVFDLPPDTAPRRANLFKALVSVPATGNQLEFWLYACLCWQKGMRLQLAEQGADSGHLIAVGGNHHGVAWVDARFLAGHFNLVFG